MHLYKLMSDADADLRLIHWWLRMRKDGDLDLTFLSSAHTLSGFMELWKTNELAYEYDDDGMTMAFWLTRYMGTAMVGLWIRSDKRKHIPTLRSVMQAYQFVFDNGLLSIFGVTKQEDLLDEHRKLGYTVLGEVPGLWDGNQSGWIVVLTADAFRANFGRIEPHVTNGE